MMFQRIERAFRRGDCLNSKTLEERPRTKLRCAQGFVDPVKVSIRVRRCEALREAEQRRESVVEPRTRRCATKEMIVGGEAAPDRSRIAAHSTAILHRNAEIFEAHALAVEHAED